MNELSLYTGSGGGLLGTALLGWTPKGYVEINEYCQRVIAQRIRDGLLPDAPIFGDVEAFIHEGYARSYQGMVDVVAGGFPCTPWSVAGRRKGSDDERNKWPATIEVIRQVRPRYCFLENVRGLLSSGYFQEILKDLAESGYDARWRVLSAAEMGAPHRRDRLWIVAHANSQYGVGRSEPQQPLGSGRKSRAESGGSGSKLGYAPSERFSHGQHQAMGGVQEGNTLKQPQRPSWWTVEPDVGRVAHGVASRVDRLKSLGNGQVPAVVSAAWQLLSGEYDE